MFERPEEFSKRMSHEKRTELDLLSETKWDREGSA
jgi:hypothetical protein